MAVNNSSLFRGEFTTHFYFHFTGALILFFCRTHCKAVEAIERLPLDLSAIVSPVSGKPCVLLTGRQAQGKAAYGTQGAEEGECVGKIIIRMN